MSNLYLDHWKSSQECYTSEFGKKKVGKMLLIFDVIRAALGQQIYKLSE